MIGLILPFVGLTVGVFLKAVISKWVLPEAGPKVSEFLWNRLKTKIETKTRKNVFNDPLRESNLEDIRKIIQDELSAYGVSREKVDELLFHTLADLENQHTEILNKLENVENLLEKVVLPLSFQITLNNPEVPSTLIEKLLNEDIRGNPDSQRVLTEMMEEGTVDSSSVEVVRNYEFLNELIGLENFLFQQFVHALEAGKENVNSLPAYLTILNILGTDSENEESKKRLNKFIARLLTEVEDLSTSSLITFLHIVDRLDRFTLLSDTSRSLTINRLLIELNKKEVDDSSKLQSIYFLGHLGGLDRVDHSLIDSILSRATQSAVDKEPLRLSQRVVRWLRKRGTRSRRDIKRSIRVLHILTRRLELRKFARSTPKLLRELARVNSEINLLILDFERETEIPAIEGLEALIRNLILILQRVDLKKFDAETRASFLRTLDNALYLQDLVSINQGRQMAVKGQSILKNLYRKEIGKYQRQTDEELDVILQRIVLESSIEEAKTSGVPSSTGKITRVNKKGKKKIKLSSGKK
ncbi:MAG: hypothetical protein ACFFCQ_00590 [Promethearchaeota archaeon]